MFRKIIFWSHLFAGVSAGLVIFSMSFIGVVLMYEPQITEYDQFGEAMGRLGNRSPMNAPRNLYRTADDQWLATWSRAEAVVPQPIDLPQHLKLQHNHR